MKTRIFLILLLNFLKVFYCSAQTDTSLPELARANQEDLETVAAKPKHFGFVTKMPGDLKRFGRNSFSKKNLTGLGIITASTGILVLADPLLTKNLQQVLQTNGISGKESFSPVFEIKTGGKSTHIGKWPKNLNTAFYNLGQGSTVMYMAAGFYILGKINKDYRASQTAGQLVESFIALGLITQVMKYSSGRETPGRASSARGIWRPFPAFSDFQNNKPRYDAFPSGHLSTLIAAITIISSNYPEKKLILPAGYSLAGLCAISMINNGVHWASDYPLAFGLGYGLGKAITSRTFEKKKRQPAAVLLY
jgi:hypothetical protein